VSLLVDRLAAYLQGQGEGMVGQSIFCLHRPSAPVACVSLHATGGYPPDRYTAREHPTVLLFARATTPGGALHKAYALYRKLHGRQSLDLGEGVYALTVEAIASPAYVGTEQLPEGLAHLASFNLLFDLRQPSS
jgi:hypothetical protein